MAAYLPELYKNNVGPAGDRRERCSVHSPNATKMRKYKDNISDMLLRQLETDPTNTKS